LEIGEKNTSSHLEVAAQVKSYTMKENPKFIISAGDHVYSFGIQNLAESSKIDQMLRHYGDFDIPWYPVVGNHDCRGSVQAQVEFSKLQPRWKMNSLYYSFSEAVKGTMARFYFLETCTLVCPTDIPREQVEQQFGSVAYTECEFYNPNTWAESSMWKTFSNINALHSAKQFQLEWLEDSLRESSEREWRFVIGHHPILSSTKHRGDNKVLVRDLLPLLKQKNIHGYFCGHDHSLQHLKRDDMDVFVSGGGGYMDEGSPGKGMHPFKNHPDEKFKMSKWGFIIVKLEGAEMTARFIGKSGEELYSTRRNL